MCGTHEQFAKLLRNCQLAVSPQQLRQAEGPAGLEAAQHCRIRQPIFFAIKHS